MYLAVYEDKKYIVEIAYKTSGEFKTAVYVTDQLSTAVRDAEGVATEIINIKIIKDDCKIVRIIK